VRKDTITHDCFCFSTSSGAQAWRATDGLSRQRQENGEPGSLDSFDPRLLRGRARRTRDSATMAGVSEGIVLSPVARGTLLTPPERTARLDEALPQIRAVLEGEHDAVAVEATLASLLWETLVQTNWCGFYRRIDERTLAVGPYQGAMGCLRIDLARGVCGACARTGELQLVPDVSLFPGHIACDDRTRSELVVPVVVGGRVFAVLDLDSPHLDAFARDEAERLVALLGDVFASASF
jgi:L-methionine (R)-S-oxide reductase